MKKAVLNAGARELRRWMLLLLCLTAFISISCGDHQTPVTESPTVSGVHETVIAHDTTESTAVYVTDTGEKYHLGSCYYLKKSKTEISLAQAKRLGYTSCKVCLPPK